MKKVIITTLEEFFWLHLIFGQTVGIIMGYEVTTLS